MFRWNPTVVVDGEKMQLTKGLFDTQIRKGLYISFHPIRRVVFDLAKKGNLEIQLWLKLNYRLEVK